MNGVVYKNLSERELKLLWDKVEGAWDHWTDVQIDNLGNGHIDQELQATIDDLESQMKWIQHEFYKRGVIYY